jgi:predicted RNA binding protein YcfA (HicA-like mRNA interferase family)
VTRVVLRRLTAFGSSHITNASFLWLLDRVVEGYTKQLKALLREHGCEFVRAGKGDHEIWRSPHAKKPVVVDNQMMSRHTANAILKQAGIKAKL